MSGQHFEDRCKLAISKKGGCYCVRNWGRMEVKSERRLFMSLENYVSNSHLWFTANLTEHTISHP